MDRLKKGHAGKILASLQQTIWRGNLFTKSERLTILMAENNSQVCPIDVTPYCSPSFDSQELQNNKHGRQYCHETRKYPQVSRF